jgi:hypothetical protein
MYGCCANNETGMKEREKQKRKYRGFILPPMVNECVINYRALRRKNNKF